MELSFQSNGKMGFKDKWIEWMKMYLKNVQFSVRVNKDLVGQFYPRRGLKQSDSVSSYLFILCTEGLSCILKHFERMGGIHGIKMCVGPSPSHTSYLLMIVFFFFLGLLKKKQTL